MFMPRADRLLRLLTAFRRLPQPVTAARLAEETGVSARTLYRDIDSLRLGGALIDGAAGVGYTLTEDPALPPQMFSRLEVEALVLGLAQVRAMGDPAMAEAAEAALAKITATLPERVQRHAVHAVSRSYSFGARAKVPPHTALIRQACWDEEELTLTFTDVRGEVTRRTIRPLAIVYFDSALVCLAWCCLRDGFRRFDLARIRDVARTGSSFRPRRVPLLRDYIAFIRERVPDLT